MRRAHHPRSNSVVHRTPVEWCVQRTLRSLALCYSWLCGLRSFNRGRAPRKGRFGTHHGTSHSDSLARTRLFRISIRTANTETVKGQVQDHHQNHHQNHHPKVAASPRRILPTGSQKSPFGNSELAWIRIRLHRILAFCSFCLPHFI